MPSKSEQILTGLILDEDSVFTLTELSNACSVQTEYIVEMIEEGIVEPLEERCEQPHWKFSGRSLVRARKARRLQQDLGINLAGAALVLDMMEELEQLRERLGRLG